MSVPKRIAPAFWMCQFSPPGVTASVSIDTMPLFFWRKQLIAVCKVATRVPGDLVLRIE